MTASGGAGSMASARSAVTVWNDGGAATRGKHISSWASNSPAEGFASIPTGPRSAPMGSPCPHRRLDGRLRAALRRAPVEADDAPGPAFPQFDLHRDTDRAPQPVGARARPSAMSSRTAGSFASPIGSSPSSCSLCSTIARCPVHSGRGLLAVGALYGWHWRELACHGAPVPPNGAVGFHDTAVWMKPVTDGELPQGSADRMSSLARSVTTAPRGAGPLAWMPPRMCIVIPLDREERNALDRHRCRRHVHGCRRL